MVAAALLGLLLGCSSEAADGGPEPSPIEADFSHSFGPVAVERGGEIADLCVSWTLDNDEALNVNQVAMVADKGFHHSNWFHVPEDRFEGPDGVWPCDERGFNEAVAAGTGGVLYAQSTQVTAETQEFGEGVVIPIAPRSRIVANVHLLNTSGDDLDAQIHLGLNAIDDAQVVTKLSGLMLQNETLAIPPMSRSAFRSACEMNDKHIDAIGSEIDFNIYYVLPHYHTLGVGMTLEAVGDDGFVSIFDGLGVVGDPWGVTLDQPFSMKGYTGLRYSCHYDNPRDDVVGWGIGDQEMCVMLAFTDSPNLWGGFAGSSADPEMVNGVATFDSSCGMLTYPSAHTR